MTERSFTMLEIDQLLIETMKECRESDWQSPYRLGYMQGIVAVQCKMDDVRRAHTHSGERA